MSYGVTYDTSNSARHGFLNFHFAVRRAIYTPVFLLCSAVIFFCTSFQVFLSTIAGWGIFDIVLPNSSIVCYRFMGQEIWCISFLKQSIAHIFLVCENTINRTPMPPTSTSRSRSFLLSKNNSNAINGHTV